MDLEEAPNDFRQMTVMPTWEDVCVDTEPFLRPSIIRGSYPDVGAYLDIQFRLLREDFFQPLRQSLLAYRNTTEGKKSSPENIRLYYQVNIINYDMQRDIYTLQFQTTKLKKVNWETSKRFIYGSLLFLSSDNFASFHLFTVAFRNLEQLKEGNIEVKYEGDGTRPPASVKRQTFVMAESTVFFESYRSVLTALQLISPTNFPLEEYILGRENKAKLPDYLSTDDLAEVRAFFLLILICIWLIFHSFKSDLL